MHIVAKVISVISKPFAHICNVSFKTGVFRCRMKIAKLIPIFKSGAKMDIGNDRPTYLLSQFSNILERLLNTVNAKDTLNSSQ